MRKQYHFRPTRDGFDAWDVDALVRLARRQPTERLALADIAEIDENYWFQAVGDVPSGRAIAEHFRLMEAASLEYPIIVCAEGRVMDGMHRVLKALVAGLSHIKAVRLVPTPPPDFTRVQPNDLSY